MAGTEPPDSAVPSATPPAPINSSAPGLPAHVLSTRTIAPGLLLELPEYLCNRRAAVLGALVQGEHALRPAQPGRALLLGLIEPPSDPSRQVRPSRITQSERCARPGGQDHVA